MTAPSSPAAAFAALGIAPPLADALATRGFTELTPVQYALIDPAHADRDLLVSAMTGSGKTVAFGLLIAPSLEGATPATARGAAPRAIVITPTRELANQVREELAWLLASINVRVVVVTGGTSVGGERRALSGGADIVVGTPGRLQDHLEHHAIDGSGVQTVVLDEADEMLDMGFREELDAILKTMPAERRTVMLSATVPREIEDLARNYQRNPARVAIDPPGQSNENISFVAHLVPPSSRVDVVVNLLLAAPDERTMVFVRTRADATDLGAQLSQLGFTAAALQGEMGQRERTQTLDAFRAGRVQTLVATDVAARGLDVPEVTMIIHADLPGDPSALTHRSGRTGRAGKRGRSVLLVPSFARRRAEMLLRAAGARAQWSPPPGVAEIERAAAERAMEKYADTSRTPSGAELALAKQMLAARDPESLVALLLDDAHWRGPTAPRALNTRSARPDARDSRDSRDSRDARDSRDTRGEWAPRAERGGERDSRPAPRPREERERHAFTMFQVNFGAKHGATAARLLAMACRRGGVRGADVGAISIGETGSTFGVANAVASGFAESAARRDTREPQIHIDPVDGPTPRREAAAPAHDAPVQHAPKAKPARAPTRQAAPPPDEHADEVVAARPPAPVRVPVPAPVRVPVSAIDEEWVESDDEPVAAEAPTARRRDRADAFAAELEAGRAGPEIEAPRSKPRPADGAPRPRPVAAPRADSAARPRPAAPPRANAPAWARKDAPHAAPRSDAPPWARASRPNAAPPRRDASDRPRPTGPRNDAPPWARRDDRPAARDARGPHIVPTARDTRTTREPAAPRGGSAQGGIQQWRASESTTAPIDIARARRAAARSHDTDKRPHTAPAAPSKGPRDAAYSKPSTWVPREPRAGKPGKPAKHGKPAKRGKR